MLHVDSSLPEAESETEGGGNGEAEGVMGKEMTSSRSKVFLKYLVLYTSRDKADMLLICIVCAHLCLRHERYHDNVIK